MDYKSLILAASFSPRHLQPPDAWVGHLPFAYWLIKQLSPQIFVELGTHSGNSYFSFCQAVKDEKLQTGCYAVDTWKGDEHAGFYEEEIFSQVDKHNQEYYADFSRLLRMTFDDATKYFSDQTIELLHIDGLHTYEAVKHDFETWLPKLSSNSIVIFHDTNVRERDFGVWKFWEEIKKSYPLQLEFLHSHGLGIIQINKDSSANQMPWLIPNSPEQQELINYFATLGSKLLDKFELCVLQKSKPEYERVINDLKKFVSDRDEIIEDLKQFVSDRDEVINNFNLLIVERDEVINNFNLLIVERDEVINNFNLLIVERDTAINELNKKVSDLTQEILGLNYKISHLSKEITQVNLIISEYNQENKYLKELLNERDDKISEINGVVNSLISELDGLTNSLSWRMTKPLRYINKVINRG